MKRMICAISHRKADGTESKHGDGGAAGNLSGVPYCTNSYEFVRK